MNDIHTRSADLAVRPRVSHVDARESQARAAEPAASTATPAGNTRPVQRADALANEHEDGRRSVEQAVARLNDYVQSLQRDIQFSIDPESNQPVVRVIDRGSQELIRQIPNETALRLARSLKELSDIGELGSVNPNDIAIFHVRA